MGRLLKTVSNIASTNVLDVSTFKLLLACEILSPEEITQAQQTELVQSNTHQ